jgi:hypothetical protein
MNKMVLALKYVGSVAETVLHRYIPVSLEVAGLLAALTHPHLLVRLSSWVEFLCRLAATPMALGINLLNIDDLTLYAAK